MPTRSRGSRHRHRKETATALKRLAALDDNQRKRLAFALDTVFGIHDLPYRLLAECNAALAEDYLQARGYAQVEADA
ncbi:hypothetical protein [Vreelandella subglaciescola]|uniref:hypothetical protein n=1 Tax=Vreelandella subglaciescola TaxID=29571 RepID=UPI0009A8CEDD|nr:hypothetical protein [Halomonas subglaciescola]